MRSLLFISIFLAFGCGSNSISTILSSFNNKSVEYTWQADVKTLIISLVNEKDQHNIVLQKALGEASAAQATDSQNFVTLFEILYPNFYQSGPPSAVLGYANPSNVPAIMDLLTSPTAKEIFGAKLDSIRFVWDVRSHEGRDGDPLLALYPLILKIKKYRN